MEIACVVDIIRRSGDEIVGEGFALVLGVDGEVVMVGVIHRCCAW